MCQEWNPKIPPIKPIIPPKIPPIRPTTPPNMPPINPIIPPNIPIINPNTTAAKAIQNGNVIISIKTSKMVGVRDMVLGFARSNKNHSKEDKLLIPSNLKLLSLDVLNNEQLILQIRTAKSCMQDTTFHNRS